jgi:DNA replication protein DnaC
MSEKIDQTLKKLAAASSKANSPNSSSTELPLPAHDLPGDPQCPQCHGMGYLRQDLPVGHPDFGRVEICSCRRGQVNQRVRQRLFALSNLEQLSHLTFENFQPRGRVGLWPREAESLQMAFNHARQFAETLNGWLLLQGGYGCGKTHLAAAIANFAVSMGVPTLFITVPDLLDSLRFSFDDPTATFEGRFEDIRSAALLILDDFGTQNTTAWAQEKLFQIINHRYINHLPLVVTTNLPLRDIEGRIRSRLEDPDLVSKVHILAQDYRQPAGASGHHELSSLDLMHRCTFANFDLRADEGLPQDDLQSLEKAFRAARDYAEKPSGWLLLMGHYASGKTHLAASIANFRAEQGSPPLFIVAPDLLDHLRATFGPSSTISLDRRFEEVRSAELLVLDDLGAQAMSPWVREKLYQLFNYRYAAELPTVITSANSLEEIDPRLRSRFLDTRLCRIYAITAPPYRGAQPKPRRSKRR